MDRLTAKIQKIFWRGESAAYILLTLAALFWAVNWVIGRAMRQAMPPVAMGFWRWMIALVILVPFAGSELREKWKVVRSNWLILAALGGIGTAGFNTMVYVSLRHTPATDAVLFNSIAPVLIILLSWVVLGEKLSAVQFVGVIVSFCGIATISTQGDWTTLSTLGVRLLDLRLLFAMVLWAIFTILLRWRPAELSPIGFLCAITLLGLPTLLPFYSWELATRGGFDISIENISALLFYAICPSILAYLFWNQGVAKIGANKAGLFSHLVPAFGALLAVVFLKEKLHVYHLVGVLLIFLGIYLTTKTRRGNI